MTNSVTSTEGVKAFYGLPQEVKYCKRCVMSNQRPNSVVEFKNSGKEDKATIYFGDDGVCSACRYVELKEKKINWEQRERELTELCNRFRSRNGSYDVIIPGSGGKDSCFVSFVLKTKYDMNPLTVTWSPHIYTDIGWKNFHNWIDSGFDNILHTPNGKVHRMLTRLAFKNLCHPFQPFVIGQRMTGPKMAAVMRVPLIMYGEHAAEYGDRVDEAMQPKMPERYYVHKPDIDSLILGGVPAHELVEKYGLRLADLNPYLPIDDQLVRSVGVEVHHFSYYHNWDPQENYYFAAEHCGFEANTERTQGSYSKYSSIDDQIDPFHYYTSLIKFGIGRATYDAAQEIRNGKITREEGVHLVHKYDTEFPARFFREFLGYIDMKESEFWQTIDRFRSPHLWQQVNGQWQLRYKVQSLGANR